MVYEEKIVYETTMLYTKRLSNWRRQRGMYVANSTVTISHREQCKFG